MRYLLEDGRDYAVEISAFEDCVGTQPPRQLTLQVAYKRQLDVVRNRGGFLAPRQSAASALLSQAFPARHVDSRARPVLRTSSCPRCASRVPRISRSIRSRKG